MAPVDTALEAANKEWTLQEYPGDVHSFLWGTANNPADALQAYLDVEAFVRGFIAAEPRSRLINAERPTPALQNRNLQRFQLPLHSESGP